MKKYFLFVVFLFVFVPYAQSLQQDYLYLSLQNNSFYCVDIIIPDDLGVIEEGITGVHEYIVYCTAGEWADLTEQIVRTDENNTVVIPICFNTWGRQKGECLENFSMEVYAPLINKSRIWKGGICVSDFRDIENQEKTEGMSTQDFLNQQKDVFDMEFKKNIVYASPGNTTTFTLMVESYANITLDIHLDSSAAITPNFITLRFNETEHKKEINITAYASQTGTYIINANARIKNCEGIYCEKSTNTRLVITDNIPEHSGFTISLFPENINIKELGPVEYQIYIETGKMPYTIETSLRIPEDMTTDFEEETITIPANGVYYKWFTVTPKNISKLYEIKVIAKSGNTTKEAISYLSTNEILTDAFRMFETSDKSNRSALDRFISTYRSTLYGNELNAYNNYENSLNATQTRIISPTDSINTTRTLQEPTAPDFSIVIVVAIIIGASIGIYIFMKMRREREESYESTLE